MHFLALSCFHNELPQIPWNAGVDVFLVRSDVFFVLCYSFIEMFFGQSSLKKLYFYYFYLVCRSAIGGEPLMIRDGNQELILDWS